MAEMREKRFNINMLVFWILFIVFIFVMIFIITTILRRMTSP